MAKLKECESQITRLYGAGIKTALRGAAIEYMESGKQPPIWTWYATLEGSGEKTRVHDLESMLVSGFRDTLDIERICYRLGVTRPSECASSESLATYAYTLHAMTVGTEE
jgi:hypothetical protein